MSNAEGTYIDSSMQFSGKEIISRNSFYVFIILVILLIFSWSIVGFYQLFFDTFFYNTLGFDAKKTEDNFMVCVLLTLLFIFVVWFIHKFVLTDVHKTLVGIQERNVQDTISPIKDVKVGLIGTGDAPATTDNLALEIGYGGPNNPIYPVRGHPSQTN